MHVCYTYGARADLAVRRHVGDRSVLARGPRVPRQEPLLVPRRRGQRGHEELGASGARLDGRVEGLFL